ncbi:MAG TPA: branched-chain amino acid ABC transporter permease [Baekduia sp.]|nr:branched-chain amino acid ABC transporter permease [Baekduia sp.]
MSGAIASLRTGRDAIAGLVPQWVFYLFFLGLAIVFPYLAGSGDFLDASIQTLAYIIMALGLNIVVGFAGLLDLGYVAFYAIGAFVIGWFGSQQFPDVNGGKGIHILVSDRSTFQPKLSGGKLDIAGIHINFFLVLFIAMAITALWGVLLGAPTLRLRGDYLAIVTLAFGEIVPRVFENSTSGLFGIGSTDFSHGRQGITPIDTINLPWSHDILYTDANLRPAYWVALGMVVFTIFVNRRLRDSRMGRAWIAVREDEVAAASMGVNLVRTKLWAYAMGAAFGGFAGVFLGSYNNTVNVDQFEFGFSVFILAMVIVGGMGNIWGVIVGAIALSMMNRYGLPQLNNLSEPLGFDVTAISFGIFGFFLLIMMVLRPEGLIPSGRRRLELHEAEIEGSEDTGPVGDMSQMYEVRQ